MYPMQSPFPPRSPSLQQQGRVTDPSMNGEKRGVARETLQVGPAALVLAEVGSCLFPSQVSFTASTQCPHCIPLPLQGSRCAPLATDAEGERMCSVYLGNQPP